ncbi:UNVERIFIED_ORG: hypothetical protein ABIC54_004445 [Burkholderia sp. 1263]
MTPDERRQWAHTVRYEPAGRSAWDRVVGHPVTFFVSLPALLCLVLWATFEACGVI